jgi:septum formation protein
MVSKEEQRSNYDLVLASASPRRSELLQAMGCKFEIVSADVDEQRLESESIADFVPRLAHAKADEVYRRLQDRPPNHAVLAADTIVVHDGAVFGKPKDKAHAFTMWRTLQNSEHSVVTAICLLYDGRFESATIESKVQFNTIDELQMERYWASSEPQDKAGAYAIQGLASAWVKQIQGSYSNIVGVPLAETNRLLRLVGHNWL